MRRYYKLRDPQFFVNMPGDLCGAILGVLIPPIQVFKRKGCGIETIIDLVLWVIWADGLGWLSIIYCWHLEGVDVVVTILILICPPLGLWFRTKQCNSDVIISILL